MGGGKVLGGEFSLPFNLIFHIKYLISNTCETFERLAVIFGICEKTAVKYFDVIGEAINKDFYSKTTENCWNREKLEKEISPLAKLLYCNSDENKVVTIWDGTYGRIQKSSNFTFQNRTFSGHKKQVFTGF